MTTGAARPNPLAPTPMPLSLLRSTEWIGMILAVDWLLDRFRTAINVWGDSVGAAFIHRATAE